MPDFTHADPAPGRPAPTDPADAANDAIQQAPTIHACRGTAKEFTKTILQAVCDLNDWDTTGSKQTLVDRIVQERWLKPTT